MLIDVKLNAMQATCEAVRTLTMVLQKNLPYFSEESNYQDQDLSLQDGKLKEFMQTELICFLFSALWTVSCVRSFYCCYLLRLLDFQLIYVISIWYWRLSYPMNNEWNKSWKKVIIFRIKFSIIWFILLHFFFFLFFFWKFTSNPTK